MSEPLRSVREVIREEPLRHDAILEAVADGGLTIVEIAEHIGHPAHEVVYWVMGMRRYGHLIEDAEADDEGYFHYSATRQEAKA